MRTDHPARVTSGAKVLVDLMSLIRRHRNRVNRTVLGADRATGALFSHLVLDQSPAAPGRASALQVPLIFFAEIAQGREDRIGRGFAQTAEAPLADLLGEPFEFWQVLLLALARAEPIQNVQHAAGTNSAEGAFAARLILGELQEVARDIDHAIRIIHHHQPARAHDRADFPERFVIHRRIGQARRDASS